MARCITADLLLDRYGVEVEPGGFYSPAPCWWLLVTASRVDALVNPQHLLLCLERLRTSTTENLILCFNLNDWYRGKVKFRWWLELIITCFINYPRIRLLDEWTHTFDCKTCLRPDMVEYISYDTTSFLQAEGHIALTCPANLITSSAALRYVLREFDREQVFFLRPQVGKNSR